MLAFLHVAIHNANTPRRSCKNSEPALSLTLSCHTHSASVPLWLYGCSLFDVFPLLNVPLLFSSSSLPSFHPFLSAIFCPASLHTWPASLWLLTSKHYFIHQSLIRERAIQCCAKREGGYVEWVYKKGGNKCMKRGHERERGSALDRREPRFTKAKKRRGK